MLRRLSLTLRLTLFFTLTAAAIVLGLGALFVRAADRHFAELDNAILADKQHLIGWLLQGAESPKDAQSRLTAVLGHEQDLLVRLKGEGGATLFESAGFESATVQAGSEEGLQVWKAGARELRVIQFSLSAPNVAAAPLRVTVAMDTAHHRHFLAALKRNLAVYVLIAMLVAGVLSRWAAHRGLSPLRTMRARAANVNAQRLDARMPEQAVPIELADLAQELNRMLGRLQDDFQRLSDFSSDLAHELRTPINNLLMQTQVTLSAPRESAVYRDILASNIEELQRLGRMVSDMLLLAKAERGVDPMPHRERFCAADEVQALLAFYEAVAQDKRIDVRVHGSGQIAGDRAMVRRALSNLLSNALRHTPVEGRVEIAISESGAMTVIAVENTGQTIAPEALPRLFDRFYRADPARTRPDAEGAQGAGLGLAITQAIAQAHGGSVGVQSKEGVTRFTLVLPR